MYRYNVPETVKLIAEMNNTCKEYQLHPLITVTCVLILSPDRGLLEVLQLDFVPKDVSEQSKSQIISWRLELPGNVKDVGVMRIYTTERDYVGLAPLVMVRARMFRAQYTDAWNSLNKSFSMGCIYIMVVYLLL